MAEQTNNTDWPSLGDKSERIVLTSPRQITDCASAMVSQGHRSMRLYSPDLEHEIYDDPMFASAVSRLARVSRNSDIRILIEDSRNVIQRGHCLLDLSRKLSSTLSIRLLTQTSEELTDSFLLVDDCGVLMQPKEEEDQGFAHFNDRVSNKQWSHLFDELWLRSGPDPQLRHLSI